MIIPCDGFVYERKPLAAVYALNGFGKTQGTVQIEELGVLDADRTDEYTKCRKGSRWACHIYGKGMQEER